MNAGINKNAIVKAGPLKLGTEIIKIKTNVKKKSKKICQLCGKPFERYTNGRIVACDCVHKKIDFVDDFTDFNDPVTQAMMRFFEKEKK